MKLRIFFAFLLILGIALPFAKTQAVSLAEIKKEITELQTQINELKSLLGGQLRSALLAPTTTSSIIFNETLNTSKTSTNTLNVVNSNPDPSFDEINAGDSCTVNFLVPPDYNSWGTYTGAYVHDGYADDGGELFSCEPLAAPSMIGQPCAVKNSVNTLSKGLWTLKNDGKTMFCKTNNFLTSLIRPGTKSSEVKILQQILKEKGFYNGVLDGSYGSGTTNAVKNFQIAQGLKTDGIAGINTLTILGLKNDITVSQNKIGSKSFDLIYKTITSIEPDIDPEERPRYKACRRGLDSCTQQCLDGDSKSFQSCNYSCLSGFASCMGKINNSSNNIYTQ